MFENKISYPANNRSVFVGFSRLCRCVNQLAMCYPLQDISLTGGGVQYFDEPLIWWCNCGAFNE